MKTFPTVVCWAALGAALLGTPGCVTDSAEPAPAYARAVRRPTLFLLDLEFEGVPPGPAEMAAIRARFADYFAREGSTLTDDPTQADYIVRMQLAHEDPAMPTQWSVVSSVTERVEHPGVAIDDSADELPPPVFMSSTYSGTYDGWPEGYSYRYPYYDEFGWAPLFGGLIIIAPRHREHGHPWDYHGHPPPHRGRDDRDRHPPPRKDDRDHRGPSPQKPGPTRDDHRDHRPLPDHQTPPVEHHGGQNNRAPGGSGHQVPGQPDRFHGGANGTGRSQQQPAQPSATHSPSISPPNNVTRTAPVYPKGTTGRGAPATDAHRGNSDHRTSAPGSSPQPGQPTPPRTHYSPPGQSPQHDRPATHGQPAPHGPPPSAGRGQPSGRSPSANPSHPAPVPRAAPRSDAPAPGDAKGHTPDSDNKTAK